MSLNNVYGKGNAGKLAWPVTGHPISNVSGNLELENRDIKIKDNHSRFKSQEIELEREKQKLKRYSKKLKQREEQLRKEKPISSDNQNKEIIIVNQESQEPGLTNEELKILAVNGGIGPAFQHHKSKELLIKDLLLEEGIHNNIQKDKIQEILSFNNNNNINNNSLSLSDIINSLSGGIWNNDQMDGPMGYDTNRPYYPNCPTQYPNNLNHYPYNNNYFLNGYNTYPNRPYYPNGPNQYPIKLDPYTNYNNNYFPSGNNPYQNGNYLCPTNRTSSCYPNRTSSCYPNYY